MGINSRGACRSPGLLDIFSPRETRDYYTAIEWAGTRPWSNGKVGLNGISYYAINQWHVAQLQPPHPDCHGSVGRRRRHVPRLVSARRHSLQQINSWKSGTRARSSRCRTAIRTRPRTIG